MVKVIKIEKVEELKPGKFEGKWDATVIIQGDKYPKTFFLSHKQMQGLQKIMDSKEIFAAVKFEDGKKYPKFIWASNNMNWLLEAFVYNPRQPQAAKAPVVEVLPTAQPVTVQVLIEDVPF